MTQVASPTGTAAIGQPLKRREDARLLTGEARFVDDLVVPGALHLAFVRSPHAHARIRSVDKTAAKNLPGVIEVFSGLDLASEWAAPMPCAWPVTADMKNPAHYPIAQQEACYVGDAVVVVVAESDAVARDAAGLVEVDYEPLPAVVDLEAAAAGPFAHSDMDSNVSYVWSLDPDRAKLDQAFAAAAHVIEETYVQQRLIPSAMEPRGVVALPQPFGGDITFYSATQVPHILKVMAGLTLGIPESKLRVVAPSVGGGFGSKLNVYAEELVALALARKLGRPVRWREKEERKGKRKY